VSSITIRSESGKAAQRRHRPHSFI
jgi:hypothetical protein